MYHISVISTTPESNRIAKPNLIPFQTELNKLCAIWLALPSPYLIFQKGVVFLSPFEPQPQIKKPHKARKYRLCREKYAIQTQGFHPCHWLLVIAKSFIFGDFPRVFLFHFREFQEKRYQKGIKILIA